MKKLELSKFVDGKYILISTPNELFFLSVEILFSIARRNNKVFTVLFYITYYESMSSSMCAETTAVV